MTKVRKGKSLDEIKPRNRAIGQVMQNKIGEVMLKNMSKRNRKRNDKSKEEEEKCWDLHNKFSRLNSTEPSMLTPKGIKFLKIAKDGFKNLDELKSMTSPLRCVNYP